jgi:hypothetical protein
MQQVLEPRAQYANADLSPLTGKSAVSWASIIAGAFVAAAVSLVLLALGSGLGFAAVSPWPDRGVSPSTFAITTAIWLIVMQWLSSAAGGYIAGRLRTKWTGTHTHEVFFRDTAHGFITWAVASVFVAVVFAASAHSAMGMGETANAISGAASGAAQDMMPMSDSAADAARKAASEAAIYTALSMVVGAFISSVAAAIGGRLRDEHP